ncbi:bifunctional folylpolyglutamate synthase/dihydrofolate synthase [Gracilibacillus caseinilyticus]|uniref:tetrahydrofolate synthase n=1 Tax=Gracilibacillus caseinilyticus TaxID=2932256 RepID=A0ABY4ESQ4_9BACI|nr:folylpolyglutamate synthase/dihydrofolate synthase family protein [Gracilibacillus caseinilyticus]UOQ47284.1 bifunctional folylpolyglutamate synthase/dihydrofolate synthase [Gracilibacillus caseinilyticus]
MIDNLNDLDQFFEQRRKFGIKPGLERLDYLLDQTGHPEQEIPTIHIAGTNGKGSTLTYLKEMLMAGEYRVGTFQSPGLPTIFDHIAINEDVITSTAFIDILNQLLPVIDDMDKHDLAPSEYEILMVITLLYFRERVDMGVIETCMGGREDVTNRVIPLVTIITSIDYDHTSFLGTNIEAIAGHKAGIIKNKVPVVIGPFPEKARQVVRNEAACKQAPVFEYNQDFFAEEIDHQKFLWKNQDLEHRAKLSMLGKHQIENASLAIQTVQLLQKMDFPLEENALRHGLLKAQMPNRMETVKKEPRIIVDGAHNAASIRQLVETFSTQTFPTIYVLFSAFRDKEVTEMLTLLASMTDDITITTFNHTRALRADDVPASYRYIADPEEAWKDALIRSNSDDLILITGSLHFVDFVKKLIQK